VFFCSKTFPEPGSEWLKTFRSVGTHPTPYNIVGWRWTNMFYSCSVGENAGFMLSLSCDLSSHSTSYTLYSCSYWCVKFWNNSDSMHSGVLDNVIDILFCINVGFVVVSTLGKKEKKNPYEWKRSTDLGWLTNWLIGWWVECWTGESINTLILFTVHSAPRCSTKAIRFATLHFQDRRGAASLRYRNRFEITVLICVNRKPYPVWFSCRRKSYPL